jgi:hypothetical protein
VLALKTAAEMGQEVSGSVKLSVRLGKRLRKCVSLLAKISL